MKALISKYHFGFRTFRSITDNILILIGAIEKAFSSKRHLLAAFVDFTKAFGMMWKYGIFQQLYKWKFQKYLPQLTENFLQDHRLHVRGITKSQQYTLENKVPQYLVLSHTLFNIAFKQ